jgi:hypothetical protein
MICRVRCGFIALMICFVINSHKEIIRATVSEIYKARLLFKKAPALSKNQCVGKVQRRCRHHLVKK